MDRYIFHKIFHNDVDEFHDMLEAVESVEMP